MNANETVEGVEAPPATPPVSSEASASEPPASEPPASEPVAAAPASAEPAASAEPTELADSLRAAASADTGTTQATEALQAAASGEPAEPQGPIEPRRLSRVAPAHIPLERIDEDTSFQLRPVGEVSALATDIARLGQLFPVDVRFKPPDRFQVICGFRRVAALRFLKRDRVLARLHTELSDQDALLMALAAALHDSPVAREHLGARREQLEAEGRLTPIARDMLAKALGEDGALQPEGVEEEVDADELTAETARRLGEINQDLASLADVFADLDESRREELLTQLRYSRDLVAWLESL
jgi:ParB family transcriptional regulator, chromosome partitioning protein